MKERKGRKRKEETDRALILEGELKERRGYCTQVGPLTSSEIS